MLLSILRVAAAEQAVHGPLQVGEREGEEVAQHAALGDQRPGRPRHAVRAAIPLQERLVGQGRAVDDVLALGTEGFVEDGGNEEGAEILGVLEGTVPVLDFFVSYAKRTMSKNRV